MKILIENPPNIKKIVKALGEKPSTVIFNYAGVIYNPGNGFISDELMAHEKTHTVQQGDDPEAWWDKYLADPAFRLNQEVEAYRNQIKYFRSDPKNRSRDRMFTYTRNIALALSGDIYGRVISYEEAMRVLKV